VAVGRMVPRKGLVDVVQALSLLDDAELVIAGGPPLSRLHDDHHYRHLMTVAEQLRVADRVQCVGSVEPATIAALDASADVFVTAPWYEPFGIAAVEAMACGTPVVASAVGGLLDTIVDGSTGVHVPPRDPEVLAATVRHLLSDSVTRHRLGERAAWRVRRRYAWDVLARRMDDVYADVIQRRQRRPLMVARPQALSR
jgi:D-inositol-3-phosphate glycosyltransferase